MIKLKYWNSQYPLPLIFLIVIIKCCNIHANLKTLGDGLFLLNLFYFLDIILFITYYYRNIF